MSDKKTENNEVGQAGKTRTDSSRDNLSSPFNPSGRFNLPPKTKESDIFGSGRHPFRR